MTSHVTFCSPQLPRLPPALVEGEQKAWTSTKGMVGAMQFGLRLRRMSVEGTGAVRTKPNQTNQTKPSTKGMVGAMQFGLRLRRMSVEGTGADRTAPHHIALHCIVPYRLAPSFPTHPPGHNPIPHQVHFTTTFNPQPPTPNLTPNPTPNPDPNQDPNLDPHPDPNPDPSQN